MIWQSDIYLNILLIFILISLGTSLYIFRYRRKTYNFFGILFLFFLIEWMLAEYFEYSFTSLFLKIIFSKITYVGIVSIPVLWFLFALQFTNRKYYINFKTISLLSILPAVTLVLVFTNEFHNLIWKKVYINETESYALIKEYNIFFWIFILYLIFFSVFGLILVSRTFFKGKYYYHWQGVLLISVFTVPLLFGIFNIFIVNIFNFVPFSTTPIIITLAIIFSIFALDPGRKNIILPIAKESVLKSVEDGVLILSPENRIIDLNPAAEKIFNTTVKDITGKNASKLFPDMDIDKILNKNHFRSIKEIQIKRKRTTYYYDLSISNIEDIHNSLIGKTIVTRNITDRVRSEEKIKYLSFHDSLTGLYNRTYFDEDLKRLDTERQLPITIVMGDVNGLKLINDTYGHSKGDILLKEIANILKESFRKEDIVSRWGGDEFISILPKTSADDAKNIVKRIKELCRERSTTEVPLSISFGISTKKSLSEDIDDILKKAENIMYKDKRRK